MPTGANLPSTEQVLDIAEDFGLELTADEANSYCNLLRGAIKTYRRLDEMVEYRPPVKYPRTVGYRPEAKDNPFNGWYWRCEIEGAPEGPLSGKTVGVKDAICVAGVPMMNGSRVLEGFIPDVDATVVTRLLDAGATIAGKTNAEDCSFSGAGHTCALGPVQNPRKPTHAPGASSNGSAVVLATGQVDMALGGDQGRVHPDPGRLERRRRPQAYLRPRPVHGLHDDRDDPRSLRPHDEHGGERGPDAVRPSRGRTRSIRGRRGVIPVDYVRDYTPAIGKGVAGMRIGLVKERLRPGSMGGPRSAGQRRSRGREGPRRRGPAEGAGGHGRGSLDPDACRRGVHLHRHHPRGRHRVHGEGQQYGVELAGPSTTRACWTRWRAGWRRAPTTCPRP